MVKEYDGKVRVVYKNFLVHPETVMTAHLAACAAGEQGKFPEFMHAFWQKAFAAYAQTHDPSALGEKSVEKIAAEIGLNVAKLKEDMKGDKCKKHLDADMRELSKFRVSGTPSFFVNGKFTMFSGPAPFKALIDKELEEVAKSGVPAGEYYQKVVMEKGEKKFVSKKDAEKK